jgi:hypothetical protein
MELFAAAEPVRLRAGQMLFRAGDSGNGCYGVEDGLLKVTMVSSSGARILAFLGRGIVGELAVLDGLARSASVVVVRDAIVRFLSKAAFEAFAEKCHELYKELIRLLAKCLRETDWRWQRVLSFRSMVGWPEHCSGRRIILDRSWAGTDRHPSEDHTDRPRRHGRHCTRERDPHPQRLSAAQVGEPLVWLLLP